MTLQNAPVEGADLTAGVTGDMDAGGALALDGATVAALTAGQVLRVRQTDDDTVTEFVTISTNAAADIDEGALLFDHPQATVELIVVTMADSGTATTVNGDGALGTSVVGVGDTTGVSDGDIVAIGTAPTREFHVVRTIVSQLSDRHDADHRDPRRRRGDPKQVALFRAHARDQGVWANRLRVRATAAPLSETTVAVAAGAGDSPVTLGTGVGLQPDRSSASSVARPRSRGSASPA